MLKYRNRKPEWVQVDSNPDKPIVGATLVGARGKGLLYGGREQVCVTGRDGEVKWYPSPDKPDASYGEDIERAGYFFREDEMRWHRWENPPQKGRALAAALAYDPEGRPLPENASPDTHAKFVIFGGEVLERPPGQKWKSVATNEVIVVDPEKETFTSGDPVPKRHAAIGATGFLDQSGKPRLEGGMQYAHNGRTEQVSSAVVRGAKDWKERQMPLVGSFLLCVPRTEDSWVNGPFLDPTTGEWEFQILRPDYTK